jgi:hypothetical protein
VISDQAGYKKQIAPNFIIVKNLKTFIAVLNILEKGCRVNSGPDKITGSEISCKAPSPGP